MNTHPQAPIVINEPPSPPAEIIAAAWLARRYRLPPATANAIREITGLGAYRSGAHR